MSVIIYRAACISMLIFAVLLFHPIQTSAQDLLTGEEPDYPLNWDPVIERIGDDSAPDVIHALLSAGTNGDTIANILMSVPDQWLDGAVFLIINMPVEDLTCVTEELFLNNLRHAYYARSNYPWTRDLPEDIFFHYVLPMRVSQEPLEDWRGYFHAQLEDRIEGLTTLDEVALAATGWADEKTGFKQTQARDQGPFETLASGYGRCEELMIVQIDACRSVGVPARQAWTPYWPFTDNNHAWTEVYCEDGRWHDLGAVKSGNYKDEGWVGKATSRTALVLSVPYGIPDGTDDELYRVQDEPGARYAIVNSTASYRDTTELKIKVVDLNDEPLEDIPVYISIYNWGALRPIAKGETDENGRWTVTAGPGGLVITAGDQDSAACAVLQIEESGPMEIILKIGLGAELPPESFWLRYPEREAE